MQSTPQDQVRRLASLLKHLQATNHQTRHANRSSQLQTEWKAICRAQRYGRSWLSWMLSFEYKAIRVDGWRAEELQLLTWTMVQDLSSLLTAIWGHGLTTQQMQARTLLFAKRDKPTSSSDGRPITILGYVARLTSKYIADQILAEWASYWPPEISGGLPLRSARDLSIMQMSVIQAKATKTMDLIKAFNLIPRRVTRYILNLLGVPFQVCDCWFKSLSRLTRVLQCGNAIGSPRLSSTGLPEGEDSMSVVGMLAISYAFHACIRSPKIHPYT